MSRYVDISEFEAPEHDCSYTDLESFVETVCESEFIDICFCRECKYSEYREDHDDYLCSNDGIYVHDADWFCADGEREGE